MNRKDVIWKLQETIIEIYKEEKLQCLHRIENDYKIKDKTILIWHSDVTRKSKVKWEMQFDYHKNIDDLLLCSDEILYFTANLYLYRPYINSPLLDSHPFVDKTLYPNLQNLEAKRFYMFCDIVSEKVYNYWDRIGDLIASFFPDLIKPERVFFPSIIEKIPKQFHGLESFIWLKSFKENEYKGLNEKRKQVVHYTSSDTAFKHKHLYNSTNKEEVEKWVKERDEIPDFYKKHINLSIEGFYQTLTFLEEIGKELFESIE